MWLTRKPKLSKLLTDYLETKQLAASTVSITRRAMDSLIEVVGDLRVNKLTLYDVERFRANLLKDKKNNVTVNIYCKTLRPVIRWASRHGFTSDDVFGELGLFKIPKQKIRVLEPVEVCKLIDSCPDIFWRARVMLAVTSGLRRGEVMNLTVNEVDFLSRTITIQEKKDTADTWRWTPKDKDCRAVPLTSETEILLLKLLQYLPVKQPYVCLTPKQYQSAISKHRDGTLSDTQRVRPFHNFNKEFKKIISSDVRCTFHDLRRTCITQWLEAGLQPHEAQELAGHASVTTTMESYVATRADLLKRASDITLNRGERT